jgi:soluble cytochrome b562
MKLRALQDGINSLMMQLDQALKVAHETKPEAEKEKKSS